MERMTNSFHSDYRQQVEQQLDRVDAQRQAIGTAADAVSASIHQGGLLNLFGTGHSHLLAEEVFYRAGGLVPVRPLQTTSLMLHESASTSSAIERCSGLAQKLFDGWCIDPIDTVIVISNSGRNAVPIEFAMAAKANGNIVIALTSLAASKSCTSRHSSGKRLYEVADLVLDNGGIPGDACVDVAPELPLMAPCSTITGSYLLHLLCMEVACRLKQDGNDVPVFRSANLDNGDEHNQQLIQRYRHKIGNL